MRLDKYLKVSRLIKRRSVAKDAAEAEKVEVNGKSAKPSKELKIGDTITIHYSTKEISVKVTSLTPSVKKEDASSMYELL